MSRVASETLDPSPCTSLVLVLVAPSAGAGPALVLLGPLAPALVLRQPLAADVLHDVVLDLLGRLQHVLHQGPGPGRLQLDGLQVGRTQLAAQQVGSDLRERGRVSAEQTRSSELLHMKLKA